MTEYLQNLTEADKKFINKQIDFYKHKCGYGGIQAFRTALLWFRMSKDFARMAQAAVKAGEAIKRVSQALQAQINAIRSE